MLVLNPRLVKFGSAVWEGVLAITIDRAAHKQVLEWSDLGPHAVLADVPEERIDLTVVRELVRDDLAGPRPSEQAELVFYTSPTASDAARKKVSVQAVVVAVTHELSLKKGAVRTIRLIAVSSTGGTDPITIGDGAAGV